MTGEKTGLSCNHDSRKTDPESEAFTCKQRFQRRAGGALGKLGRRRTPLQEVALDTLKFLLIF